MARNYFEDFKHLRGQLKQHGVKGMRWGVRRSSTQLRSAAKARGDAPKKPPAAETTKSSSGGTVKKTGDIQDKVESSADRYSRLTAQAKGGGAAQMTEADLKFYNARTDALAKINKVTQEEPTWLRKTAVSVIQQSAQRQMQSLSDTLADKYIGDPLKAGLKGKDAEESISDAIVRTANSQLRDKAIKDGVADYIKKRSS